MKKSIKKWFLDQLVEKGLIDPDARVFDGRISSFGREYGFAECGARRFFLRPQGRQEVIPGLGYCGTPTTHKMGGYHASRHIQPGDRVILIDHGAEKPEGHDATPSMYWMKVADLEYFEGGVQRGYLRRVVEWHNFRPPPRGMAKIGGGHSKAEVLWVGTERRFQTYEAREASEGRALFLGENFHFQKWDPRTEEWVDCDRPEPLQDPSGSDPEAKESGKPDASEGADQKESEIGSSEPKFASGAGSTEVETETNVGAAIEAAKKPAKKRARRKAKGVPSAT